MLGLHAEALDICIVAIIGQTCNQKETDWIN